MQGWEGGDWDRGMCELLQNHAWLRPIVLNRSSSVFFLIREGEGGTTGKKTLAPICK